MKAQIWIAELYFTDYNISLETVIGISKFSILAKAIVYRVVKPDKRAKNSESNRMKLPSLVLYPNQLRKVAGYETSESREITDSSSGKVECNVREVCYE